jgi:precorrin-6B methylase 2
MLNDETASIVQFIKKWIQSPTVTGVFDLGTGSITVTIDMLSASKGRIYDINREYQPQEKIDGKRHFTIRQLEVDY